MSRDTTVIRLRQPDAIDDPLSELAREGARRMLGQVLSCSCPHYLLTADAGDEGAVTVIEGRVLATALIDPQPHLTTCLGRARHGQL